MLGKRTTSAALDLKARRCQHCRKPLTIKLGEAGRKRFCNSSCRMAHQRASEKAVTPRVGGGVGRGRDAGAPGPAAQPTDSTDSTSQNGLDLCATWDASSQVKARFGAQGEAPQSRYYAKFAAAGTARAGADRRFATQRLRSALRDVTTVDRCRRCGRDIVGTDVAIVIKGGVAHISGVETCGRIWLCPVCSAKIRVRRGEEVAIGVGNWIKSGGACYFVTATLPHERGDRLSESLATLSEAWRWSTSLRSAKNDVEKYGVVGNIKSVEITHGMNGWHPHIHSVILTEDSIPLDDPTGHRDMHNWYTSWDARWARALERVGWATGLEGVRLRLDMVEKSTVAGLAAYVTKLQTGNRRGLGNEIARADLKGGRKSSRTPFEILANFATSGDLADLELWHEYEVATAGRSAIRWSRGLRDLVAPELAEQTDEEVAAEEVGGETLAFLRPDLWYRLAEIPGGDALILDAAESGGLEAVIRTLVALRLDPDGVVPAPVYETL